MFNPTEEKRFLHNANTGVFPPEKPRFTMTEDIHHTKRRMEEVIDRLLKFEERVKNDMYDISRSLTSDNVIFKDTMNTAYLTFLQEVKNEVNLFESNVDNSIKLFQSDIETNYATLDERVFAKVDELENKYDEDFTTFKTSIQELTNSFMEGVNSRIDANNSTFEQAFADYQQKSTTKINMFEATVNNTVENFVESVNNSIQVFRETWEQIITERLNSQDSKLDDAELYMRTNLVGTVTALVGDMESQGKFAEIIEGEIFNDFEKKVASNGVSVLSFGAIGNGIDDDTSAIQTAINNSNKIYLPKGTYKVTSTLIIPKEPESETGRNKVVIYGDFEQTIIKFEGSGNVIENNADLIIKDVWVEGNGNNDNGLYNSGNVKMYRCRFNNNGKNGLMFDETSHSAHNIIDTSTFYKNKMNGIYCVTNIEAQKTAIKILNSYCCNNGSMEENKAEISGNGNGILLGACLGVSVLNCVCEYNHGSGLLIRNNGNYGIHNVTVVGNYFEGNRLANIYVNNDNTDLIYEEIFIKSNYYSVYPITDGNYYENSLLSEGRKTIVNNSNKITSSIIDDKIYNNDLMLKSKTVVYLEHGNINPKGYVSLTTPVENLDKSRGLKVTALGQIPLGTFYNASYTTNENEIRIDVFNITDENIYFASHGFVIETTY